MLMPKKHINKKDGYFWIMLKSKKSDKIKRPNIKLADRALKSGAQIMKLDRLWYWSASIRLVK